MTDPPAADRVGLVLRPEVDHLSKYTPGRPIEEVKRELGLERVVKLASNESPLPPFPAALEAIERAAAEANRYPDADCTELKSALASRLGLSTHELLLGNGSNEVLRVIAAATIRPGDQAVMAQPSFIVYPEVVRVMGGQPVRVPLAEHRHDLEAMRRAVTSRTRLVFVCSPNNPTGTVVGRDELKRFLEDLPPGVLTVMDEAYAEYVDDSEAADGLETYREGGFVAVLRTFSKIYGLAGLRVGYGVMPAELVEALDRVREPFNVNRLGQAAALASLASPEELVERRRSSLAERAYVLERLEKLGVAHVPSQANFVFLQLPLAEATQHLLSLGIIVRPMGEWNGRPAARVTIGTREENEAFLGALARAMELT